MRRSTLRDSPAPTRTSGTTAPRHPRNDPRQYDHLAGEWWDPNGAFVMLHWLARARASLIPPASRPSAVLVDLGCGGGLLSRYVGAMGYRHVGVDLVASALGQAAGHGVLAVRGDVTRLPLADGCADVVSAGEILEHVPDLPGVVAEASRVLRPGGRVVLDTLADTALCRLVAVHLGERIPGGAPPGIHDPALFVDPGRLTRLFARHGVRLEVRGIRPASWAMLRWMLTRRGEVPMVPVRSTSILYQGIGTKTPKT